MYTFQTTSISLTSKPLQPFIIIKIHYNHRTVTLYPENLAKSANLYKNILIEDLNEVEKINMNRN